MPWIKTAAMVGLLAGVGGLSAQTAPPPLPGTPTPQVQPRFVVVLDAAHGGSDAGAQVEAGLAEKQITLDLEQHLRSLLHARGMEVVTTREADVNLSAVDRAQTANHAMAAACVVIHATATGSGVHLFTSSLAAEEAPAPGQWQPWQSAQAAHVTQSMKLEAEIDSALAHAQVPVTLGRASVQPMDSLACPAVAVEVAPLVGGHVTSARPLTDAEYQRSIVNALAAALEQWRSDWKQ